MFEFHLNLPDTTHGHVCLIGPTVHGMTTSNWKASVAKVETGFSEEEGWTATTHILAHAFTGIGSSEEAALYDLMAKVDEVFWQVHELRDQIARMATDVLNQEPST